MDEAFVPVFDGATLDGGDKVENHRVIEIFYSDPLMDQGDIFSQLLPTASSDLWRSVRAEYRNRGPKFFFCRKTASGRILRKEILYHDAVDHLDDHGRGKEIKKVSWTVNGPMGGYRIDRYEENLAGLTILKMRNPILPEVEPAKSLPEEFQARIVRDVTGHPDFSHEGLLGLAGKINRQGDGMLFY